MNRRIRTILTTVAAVVGLVIPAAVYASSTPTLNQTVNAGTLSTDILQSDDTTPVASPSVTFPALNRSFACQTNTSTLGDSNNRIYVTNFSSYSSWNLQIAATGGTTATWTSGSNTYKFNDGSGSGCTNGQMTVDASVGTVTTNCSSVCNGVSITKGSSTAFDTTTNANISLMSAGVGTAWKGYITGVGLSQKIPASQPSGSYTLGMTLTATGV